MNTASKEDHNVHSEGEGEGREKRLVGTDSTLEHRLTNETVGGTMDPSDFGTPPLFAVQEFIAALAAATDGMSTPLDLKMMKGKLQS